MRSCVALLVADLDFRPAEETFLGAGLAFPPPAMVSEVAPAALSAADMLLLAAPPAPSTADPAAFPAAPTDAPAWP
jgi:hypothetical protein